MQDKIDCNKINEIREERMQTQFYTGSVTPLCLRLVLKQPT